MVTFGASTFMLQHNQIAKRTVFHTSLINSVEISVFIRISLIYCRLCCSRHEISHSFKYDCVLNMKYNIIVHGSKNKMIVRFYCHSFQILRSIGIYIVGVQGNDTQTQLSGPLLLSCRVRLLCVGKVYTRAQAEPGPTRLLPDHLGLPQTNKLGQRTDTGRYRSSSHQEDCCLPHGTHKENDRRQTPTVPSPTSC